MASWLGEMIDRFRKSIISSLKVMANLDIADRRLPQDGRIEKVLDGDKFDIRISVLPTRHGESVALRLLNRSDTFLTLNELGLPESHRSQLDYLIRLPYGLILFSGPTGSGKTTSQYAVLEEANDRKRKIITLENPVEYQIEGITQLQIQNAIGFTFAQGLRSVLRHDPDVILVGEIRDDETAAISVSAAPRQTWRGSGCPHCRFTGYHGRRALFEIMTVRDALRSLIAERAPSTTLFQKAVDEGLVPLRRAGWNRVFAGETTIEEVLRITGDSSSEHLSH